ncbi:hypothetical protein K439DRAFT_399015 [Ramaria rubella]|nr:hypothetical protein K439DRAFT_399015 [Ramaria rubella]
MSQAAPPVGSFAAALAAVHRQPMPQHSPLPHQPRSRQYQNRYHEHKFYPVRPTSEAHRLPGLSSQPTMPPASKSESQRLTSAKYDRYSDWKAEPEKDQFKPTSQESMSSNQYPVWRAESERDQLKPEREDLSSSNDYPDWRAESKKDRPKSKPCLSTQGDWYPDWRAASESARRLNSAPEDLSLSSSDCSDWRAESEKARLKRASLSSNERLSNAQDDGYPDWKAESQKDQLKLGSQASLSNADDGYPDWRAEAEKDRLKSQEAFCSNESPDWGAPYTKDGSKLSSTKDDGYPDWRAESQKDRSELKFPDPSLSSNRWRAESNRDRFARGGKWETGHSAEDLGLHTPFSTSMRSERQRIQNRDEYLRKVPRKM